MEINRQGATRVVFVFDRFVVKVPNFFEWRLFLWGLLSNMQERLWSGKHPDLARVLWADPLGLVVVMEKAEIIPYERRTELRQLLKQRYKDDDLRPFLLSDCKYTNWGYVKGRLVKIDYGS